jgi:hypothetical protein
MGTQGRPQLIPSSLLAGEKFKNSLFQCTARVELIEDEQPRGKRPSEVEIIHHVRKSLSYSDL